MQGWGRVSPGFQECICREAAALPLWQWAQGTCIAAARVHGCSSAGSPGLQPPQSPASASPSPQSGASVAPWRRICSFCKSLPPWTWWLWEIDMGSDQPCSSRPSSTLTSGLLNLSTIALLRIQNDSSLCGAVPYIVGCLAGPLDTSSNLYPSRDKPNGLQILPVFWMGGGESS